MELVLAAMAVLSIDLPTAETNPMLREPDVHRARVTVTSDAILFKPKLDGAERKVATLKAWVPAASDLEGRKIVPLAAALAPPKLKDDEPAERFFNSEVDGWLELYVDRGAPWDLVLSVMYSASDQVGTFGCAVRTPDADRLLVVSPPVAGEEMGDVLTLRLDRDALWVAAADGTPRKTKRTVESARAAVTAFAKKKAKGRRPLLPGTVARFCFDPKTKSAPLEQCWRASLVVAGGDGVTWGDALPLTAAAAETVPWVVFGSF